MINRLKKVAKVWKDWARMGRARQVQATVGALCSPIFHYGVHTEYAGPGRVRFFSFFRGAGYVVRLRSGRGWDGRPLDEPGWRPNIYIPGFTIYIRTKKSRIGHTWGKSVKFFRITRNGNQAIL